MFSGASYAQMSQADAFAEGGLAGSIANIQALYDSLTAAKGAAVIKDYDPNALPSGAAAYDANIVGVLTSGGSTKINNCGSGNAGGTDQPTVQHCEAVNAVNNQASMPAQTIIKPNDPILAKANAIRSNPEAFAGSFVSAYTGCTTTTVTTAGASVIQTCNDYGELAPQSCKTGTAISLDPDYFYKCLETIQTPASSTCNFGRAILIDTDTNYQCKTNAQSKKTYTCNKTAVLSAVNSTTWAGAGQIVSDVSMAKGLYLRIIANSSPNDYTVCMKSSWSYHSGQNCDYNVWPGKGVFLTGSSICQKSNNCEKYYAVWASIGCNSVACTITITTNPGCYSVSGCQIKYSTGPHYGTWAQPMTSVLSKSLSWQDDCAWFAAASYP